MKEISTEKFIEKLEVDIYPITIIKFLLNKKRILSYFSKAENKNFELRGTKYLLDNSNCESCKVKEKEQTFCRQHTSIFRVFNSENIAFDVDTKVFFFKNEIFKQVGDKLVIIYCPHPKLIKIIGEEITDANVRKINPITVQDPKLIEKFKLTEKTYKTFSSNELLSLNMKCWFNDTFSIITLSEDMNFSNWALLPNK